MSFELDLIREKNQVDVLRSRQQHRDRQRDHLRCGLDAVKEELEVNETEILKLCNRMKRRKQLEESDMVRLSQGFISSAANIETFLKTTGALNVLVKELTGSSGEKQVLAAEVFCNLSLGGSGSCLKIAKHIATYLMPMVSSLNHSLAETSLWILFNLIAASERALEVFQAQGLDLKLQETLENISIDETLKCEATKCLSVLVSSPLFGNRTLEDLQRLLSAAVENWTNESPRLIYELLQLLNWKLDSNFTVLLIPLLIHHLAKTHLTPLSSLIFCIRILGNLSASDESAQTVLNVILSNQQVFVEAANSLLQSGAEVRQELLWAIGNVLQSAGAKGEKEEEALIETIIHRLIVERTAAHQFAQYMEQQQGQVLGLEMEAC